jgi:glutathione S-transferase
MTVYQLHYFPESGNSYKLALMLSLCGAAFEPVWTSIGGGITRTATWRSAVNEMGEIPVLEEDRRRLTQTGPIRLRLAERYGRYGGRTMTRPFAVLRWLYWDNQKLSGFIATYRYLRAFTVSPSPQVLAYLRARIDDFVSIAEAHFAGSRFVVGEKLTVADISMVGYLVFPPEESGYDLAATHSAMRAWLDRAAALPGWKPPYELLPGPRLRRHV